jgi:hypothetical protein
MKLIFRMKKTFKNKILTNFIVQEARIMEIKIVHT